MRTLNASLVILLIALAMTLTACGGGGGGGDDDSGGGSDNGSDTNDGDDSEADAPPTENYTLNGLDGVNAPADRTTSGAGAHLTLFSFGIDETHQEFENLSVPMSFGATDDDGSAYTPSDDDSGVGTFYAGLAVGQNVGIAPAAAMNNVRVFSTPDERELGNSREALAFTIDNVATDVLMLTYDVYEGVDNAEFTIELTAAATANDWAVVMSGGNVAESVSRKGTFNYTTYADDPEWNGQMIVVGAVDSDGAMLENSATAWTPGSYTDELGGHFIVAPGQAICSSGTSGGTGESATACESREVDDNETSESSYFNGTGTGPATALVSGAATAIRGRYPSLDAATVVDVLLCSADDLGEPGYDILYGAGRLNVQAAITLGQTIADGGDFGDCDVPPETPELTYDDDDGGNDSTDLPSFGGTAQPAAAQYSVTAEPAGEGTEDCKAYIRDTSGLLYFQDRRGNFSLSEAGCMPALY